jgi:PiT family inorganic phosphate transporter
MIIAWLVTLPAAALMGVLTSWLAHGVTAVSSPLVGDLVIFAVLVGLSFHMWWRAQQQKVDHTNVNSDWDVTTNSIIPVELRAVKDAQSAPTAEIGDTNALI